MSLRISKNNHLKYSLLMLVLICAGCSNNSKKSESKEFEYPKERQELQLNIALVVSDKDILPKLAFIVKNNSKVDIDIPKFCEGENRLEIFRPNRKRARVHTVLADKIRNIVIKPSESKIWFMDATELFVVDNAEGLYRIKWKIYDEESSEILLLRENSKSQENNNVNKKYELSKELEGLELNIAIIVPEKETSSRLAFIAKNNSNIDITVPEFPLGENRIEIFRPNRKRAGIFTIQSSNNSEYTTIKPSGSKKWYMDEEMFHLISLEEGINRFIWKIHDVESPELLLLKEIDKEEN